MGLLLLCLSSSAQFSSLRDKFYFGGGFGLNIGTNITNISVSPLVGYKITDRLSAGVGVMYQYVDFKIYDITVNNYGGSIFSRYIITRQFFATTEFEYLNFEFVSSPTESVRQGFDSWFIGGGFVQPLGRMASFTIIGLYNLLYDDAGPSPYNSPFVLRAGINVGF
jgi:hypothetical protein